MAKSALLLLLIVICVSAASCRLVGCQSKDGAKIVPASQSSGLSDVGDAQKEKIVLGVVKKYYEDRGWTPPKRVVIVTRGTDVWLVHAGPELKEAGLEIDPNTGRVISFIPGD